MMYYMLKWQYDITKKSHIHKKFAHQVPVKQKKSISQLYGPNSKKSMLHKLIPSFC